MSDVTSLRQKSVVILGYGVNNRALTTFLLRNGISLTIRDRDAAVRDTFAPQYAEFGDQVVWDIRQDILADLSGFDVLFRAPVISSTEPRLVQAVSKGAQLSSQTQLFLELCPAITIGITGTKGKGTTSTLAYEILSRGYKAGRTFLAGNIGVDPFSFLDDLQEDDIVLLELSSFQLEDVRLSPHIAVVLHVTQDHLDHHKNLEEYRHAKARILTNQRPNDIAIVNAEYATQALFLQNVQGKLFQYSRHQPRQQSAWVENLEGKEIVFVAIGSGIESFEITGRKLLGAHNIENILPAAILGAYFHVSPLVMSKVVTGFTGLEHRLSLVAEKGGVSFYDDSIATTNESCVVAMEAFEGRRIHLLVGGKDKGQTHEELAKHIAARCTTVSFLPGAVTAALRKALEKEIKKTSSSLVLLPLAQNPVMETILSGIHTHLKGGDVVLLAPAAASDTPFANYKLRGEAFAEAIHKRYGA